MSWALGYDNSWNRDVGYGVPSKCDLPRCKKEIDRGLSFVCGGEPYGGEYGCGLFFCPEHFHSKKPRGADGWLQQCPRCYQYRPPYAPKPDVKEWVEWKLNDESWALWRKNNPDEVLELQSMYLKE